MSAHARITQLPQIAMDYCVAAFWILGNGVTVGSAVRRAMRN